MLDFEILHRKGSEEDGVVVRESYSSDFTVNGESLLATIVSKAGGHSDFLGCFARGWDNLNEHSFKQLSLQELPESDSGRRLIYVCPECADAWCGAYGCKITREGNSYIWSDFAYENGYEDPVPIQDLGPFVFSAENYEAVIQAAYEL